MSIPEPDPVAEGIVVPEALIKHLTESGYDHLIPLIRERDAFGRAKYGQPLMSEDGRNGIEDARQELGDLLQYVYKCHLAGEDLTELQKDISMAYQVIKNL